IGLGILGLAVGAIVAGSIKEKEAKQPQRNEWIDRCSRRYPSFDPRTGTFIGRDGREYYCR
ncbi:BA14K family protein, partial [Rhizobiaceae sp. 2RAB30]